MARKVRVRAAHLLVTKGHRQLAEVFDRYDIASRFAADRVKHYREDGWTIDRHDFFVGTPNDPAILRPAVDLVVRHLGAQNPNGNRYEFVAEALRTVLTDRVPRDHRPGRVLLIAPKSDPVRQAFRTVQRAKPAALRFIDATPPADH